MPPRVLTVPEEAAKSAAPSPSSSSRSLWAWVGLVFLVVGATDLLLAWLPTKFGNREWEFGTVTSVLNGMPVAALGLAAMVWSAGEGGRRRWLAWLSLVVALIMLLTILGGLVLWATGIPLALHSVPAQVGVGLKKALIKTSVQGVAYPILLVYLVGRAWRTIRGKA